MKEKKESKLRLNKSTIQDLESLNLDEQKVIKGGTDSNTKGTTIVPVYC